LLSKPKDSRLTLENGRVNALLANAVYLQKLFFCPWYSDAHFLQGVLSKNGKVTMSEISDCGHSRL